MKRSETICLAVMGAAVVGSAWYESNVQNLSRNRYARLEDCECDYRPEQCSSSSYGGGHYGPWYLSDPELRRQDARDPGPGSGNCLGGGGGHGGGGGSGSYGAYGRYDNDQRSRGPIYTQEGYRHGFGGTARAGRAGG